MRMTWDAKSDLTGDLAVMYRWFCKPGWIETPKATAIREAHKAIQGLELSK